MVITVFFPEIRLVVYIEEWDYTVIVKLKITVTDFNKLKSLVSN